MGHQFHRNGVRTGGLCRRGTICGAQANVGRVDGVFLASSTRNMGDFGTSGYLYGNPTVESEKQKQHLNNRRSLDFSFGFPHLPCPRPSIFVAALPHFCLNYHMGYIKDALFLQAYALELPLLFLGPLHWPTGPMLQGPIAGLIASYLLRRSAAVPLRAEGIGGTSATNLAPHQIDGTLAENRPW